MRLAGYDLELAQGEDSIYITLWWQALENPRADYTVFLHLFDSTTESIVAQRDAQPQGGAYPTSWWIMGEVVSDTVTLALTDVPEGTYQVAIGLYDQTLARLQASAREDQGMIAIDDDRLILPEVILMEE